MNVNTIQIDKELALEKYKEYLEAAKKTKSKEYSAARRAYRALSKGLKVIDIYDAFKKTGLKADGNPKLAIVRADAKEVQFRKLIGGAGRFSRVKDWSDRSYSDNVELPESTFTDWPTSENNNWQIQNERVTTNVPFIPPNIHVPGKLENYYILFEVSTWRPLSKVKDPYLLQRLNDNTFVVLAEWDVTDVEAMIMRTR